MKDKKTVVLDLTGCTSLGEMHLRIRDAFRFPILTGRTGTRSGI